MESDMLSQFIIPDIPEDMDRPYIVVNCAVSVDGKLALPDGRQTRISSEEDIAFVHKLRNWADAVIVGINTVLKDDPKLTVKEKYVPNPEQPLRVVVDSCCRTPAESEILSHTAPTLIATTKNHWPFLGDDGQVEMVECGGGEQVDLNILISYLWDKGIRKILVEGGGTLISSFLKNELVDVFMIFIGDMVIGGERAPTPVMGLGAMDFDEIVNLERYAVIPMDGGVRIHYRVKKK